MILQSEIMWYNKNMKKTINQKFYTHKFDNIINVQKIVTIHYQKLEKKYVSKTESHDFWEINYADKDRLKVIIENEVITLNQGELLFIPPNKEHYLESENREPNVFIISFICRSKIMELFSEKKYKVNDNYRYLLQNIMTEAEDTFNLPDFDPDLNRLELKETPNLGGEQIIKNSLELLLVYILRSATNKQLTQEFFISKIASSSDLHDEIVHILNSKIYDTLNLDDICSSLHYGKTYICTTFKRKTGMSIYKTYLKLKIDEAKKLIRKKLTFSAIAEKLCFDSVAHFNETFKKFTNMTPSEYKSSIK